MIFLKPIKLIGLICLICFTFIYTEKTIDISIEQDEIMMELNNKQSKYNIEPKNAIIKNNTIIPGHVGKHIDINSSYKQMKKLGYFEESLIIYKDTYPEISIHNNYNKYTKKHIVNSIHDFSIDEKLRNIHLNRIDKRKFNSTVLKNISFYKKMFYKTKTEIMCRIFSFLPSHSFTSSCPSFSGSTLPFRSALKTSFS